MDPHIELTLLDAALLAILIFSAWGVGYLWETHQNSRPGRVIYHASNRGEQGPLVADIIRRYGVETKKAALIEPGAGMAIMSHYLARRFTWRSVEAVELGGYIQFLGRLRYLFRPDGVKLVRRDLLTYRYPAGSVVYCYLFPSLVTQLYEQGRLDGCLVISLIFPIKGLIPTEEVALSSWQARLLIYDLRVSPKGTAGAGASAGAGRPEPVG